MKNRIGLIYKLMVVAAIFILVVGCHSHKETDKNVKTIHTFLEKEFTGPGDELKNALEQDGAYPSELEAYVEENYKPLVMNLEDMINKNHVLLFLRFAYENGYQLKPTNINIQKVQDHAYDYEVKVEYSREGQTNTATITARINLNDDGKIVTIRNMNDEGFLHSQTNDETEKRNNKTTNTSNSRSPIDIDVEKYINEKYAMDHTRYVTDRWENEDTGRAEYTVKILPDTNAFGHEINEIFKNSASNEDERTKEMIDMASKIMNDLTDDKIHIDSVNWVSYDSDFTVTLIQDYENSDLNAGDHEDAETLSQYSSDLIEYARVWLQLGPNQGIDELNVQHIPAGTLLNSDDGTNVGYPEDVIQLRGSRIVDGIVTYSGNGDGTINVYNIPSRWYGGFTRPDDIDKDKVREDMRDIINHPKLVHVDPGEDEDIRALIQMINVRD